MSDDFRMDWDRIARTGTSEAVLCDSKSAPQIDAIVGEAIARGGRLLLTRMDTAKLAELAAPIRAALDYDPLSCEPEELRELSVVATMCGGRWTHNPPPWD